MSAGSAAVVTRSKPSYSIGKYRLDRFAKVSVSLHMIEVSAPAGVHRFFSSRAASMP